MTILTQGIVLTSDHHKEYDRNYTIYTSDLGKIYAICKSAKKITSKLSPHLGQFFVIDLMLAGSLQTKRIAGAQIANNYSTIQEDLSKVVIGNYFLEVVDLLVKPDFPDTEVFKILDNFLLELSISETQEASLIFLNKSLFNLLSHLGYCPIIRSKTQKDLIGELNVLITEVCERKVNCFDTLFKIYNNLTD